MVLQSWLAQVPLAAGGQGWQGVDRTVVESVAAAAGRHPWKPLVDLGQGDLPLFAFLCAGTVGGFVMGYAFRALFTGPSPDRALAPERTAEPGGKAPCP